MIKKYYKNFIILFLMGTTTGAIYYKPAPEPIVCQTCQQCTMERAVVTDAAKAAYCSELMTPSIQWLKPDCPECDCAIDHGVGRINGWAECVDADNRMPPPKEKEKCKGLCPIKILRR